jgi:thioesterase domain-containing protein
LSDDRCVYGIESPLLNDESSRFLSIEDFASHYISLIKSIQPIGPYIISGWSFGGVVAYEMAGQLEASSERVNLFLYDSWAKHTEKFNEKSYFKKIYNRLNKQERWYSLLWKRMCVLLKYKPGKTNSYITLFKAMHINEEYIDVDDPSNHWNNVTDNSINIVSVPGDHSSLLIAPNVKCIASMQNVIIKNID